MKIVALDIGGTSIKSGLYENGCISQVREHDTDARRGGAFVMERAKEIIRLYSDFERIGISTAGQVDSSLGTIRYANSNIPGYTGMEIKKILEAEFHVPVAVENDVNAAAVGEANFGAGKQYPDFLCLTYGTGVGGAIIQNRNVYTGSCFSAGEFGGIVTHAEERKPSVDMFSGCYERYASTTALVQKALAFDPSLVNGREIFSRIKEPAIQQLVDDWVQEIVYGLTTLIHIFNPSCIILGGGVMKQPYILDKIQDILYDNVMESFHDLTILQAELGNMAGLYGAVWIALQITANKE